MSTTSFILTDVERGLWLDHVRLARTPELDLAGAPDWSITKRTLRGGRSDGVDVIELDNGALAVSILPTRGMGLWKARYRGLGLGWQSPVRQPVNPCFVNLAERGGLGWLTGFNELLCRCGLAWQGPPGDDQGWPLTLHGKIANTPAHHVELQIDRAGPGTLRVIGTVDESTMFGPCLRLTSTVETQAGSNRLRITDRVTNLGGQPQELQLLYHLNLGRPLLGEGARLHVAAKQVAPKTTRAAESIDGWNVYGPPTPGFAEQVYFIEPATDAAGNTLVLLHSATAEAGLSVRFDTRQLPHFIVWKNTMSEAEGYVTGLEPSTCFPNFKSYERAQGRVISLPPGASYEMGFEIAVYDTAEAVQSTAAEIAKLQGNGPPKVHRTPLKGWSADAE